MNIVVCMKQVPDTAEDASVYEAGGVLQRFAQDFLAKSASSAPPASAVSYEN